MSRRSVGRSSVVTGGDRGSFCPLSCGGVLVGGVLPLRSSLSLCSVLGSVWHLRSHARLQARARAVCVAPPLCASRTHADPYHRASATKTRRPNPAGAITDTAPSLEPRESESERERASERESESERERESESERARARARARARERERETWRVIFSFLVVPWKSSSKVQLRLCECCV